MNDKEKYLNGDFEWEDIKSLVQLYDDGLLNRAEFRSYLLDALYVPRENAIVIGNYFEDPIETRKKLVREAKRAIEIFLKEE